MKELKNATLVEGLVVKDYALRTYSEETMERRFGRDAVDRLINALKQKENLLFQLCKVPECKKAGRTEKDCNHMSVPAIMDFYRNGPKDLHGSVKGQMVMAHKDYIYYLMNHYFVSFTVAYADDLYDCGVIGLLKAMEGYNGNNAFTTYSKFYIVHEMAAFTYYLQGNPSCYYAKIQRKIKDVMMSYSDTRISVSEISRQTGINPDIVSRELMMMRNTELIRFDEFPSLRDTIEDTRDTADTVVEKKIITEMLADAIRRLDDNERELLLLHFWNGYSFGRIAKEKGVCYSRVKKRYNDVLDKLRKEFF